MRRVIDSSVACKLILEESLSDVAEKLLAPGISLLAPDFIQVEIANVLWKRVRRAEFRLADARELLAEAERFPIELRYTSDLLPSALGIAAETGRTVYDSCYIALAQALNAPCVTADERLFNALGGTTYRKFVVLLSSL